MLARLIGFGVAAKLEPSEACAARLRRLASPACDCPLWHDHLYFLRPRPPCDSLPNRCRAVLPAVRRPTMSQPLVLIPYSQAKTPLFVGVDLGGTNIKVGVVDDLGRPLAHTSIPTDPHSGPRTARGAWARRFAKSSNKPAHRGRPSLASASARPARWTSRPACCLDPPNLPSWENFPIRDRVSHHCGLPVTFAERRQRGGLRRVLGRRGRAFHSMVLFTLGTGIGCGIIIGDMIIDGEHSHGAECGHIIIDHRDDAPMCRCGQPGHLEAYASATAVVRRTEEALAAGRPARWRRALGQGRGADAADAGRARPRPATRCRWRSCWRRPATWASASST